MHQVIIQSPILTPIIQMESGVCRPPGAGTGQCVSTPWRHDCCREGPRSHGRRCAAVLGGDGGELPSAFPSSLSFCKRQPGAQGERNRGWLHHLLPNKAKGAVLKLWAHSSPRAPQNSQWQEGVYPPSQELFYFTYSRKTCAGGWRATPDDF